MSYKITDLVGYEKLYKLFESYSKLFEIPFSLVDYKTEELLMSFNLPDMCINFHIKSEKGLKVCNECKINLHKFSSNKYQVNYSNCGFGASCAAIPVVLEEKPIAYLRAGQVFYKEPDLEKFRDHAKKYGFDSEKYIESIKKTPVISKDKFSSILEHLSHLSVVITELGFEALKRGKAELHCKSLYENMNESIVVFELVYDEKGEPIDYVIKETNPEFIKTTGSSKEKLIGISGKNLFPDEKGEPAFINKISTMMKTNNPIHLDVFHPIIKKHYSTSIFPLETNSFATIARDITELKKNENELIELNNALKEKEKQLTSQNEKLINLNNVLETSQEEIKGAFNILKEKEQQLRINQFVVDNSAVSVLWIGPEGDIYFANKMACKMLGYTEDEMLSLKAYDINKNYTIEKWRSHYKNIKAAGFSTFETTHTSKEGRETPVLIQSNYFEYEGMEFNLAFTIDISEQKNLQKSLRDRNKLLLLQNKELQEKEKELAKTQALLIAALEQSPSGIIIVENKPNFEVKFTNSEALKFLGVSKEFFNFKNNNIDKAIFPFSLKTTDGKLLEFKEYPIYKSIKENRTIKNVEILIENARGETYNIITNTAPIYGKNGEIIAGIIVEHDITEIKKARESLKESEEKYSLLFNAMTEGFAYMEAIYNDNGKIVDFRLKDINPIFENIIEIERKSLLDKSLYTIFNSNVDFWVEKFKEVTETGRPVSFVKPLSYTDKILFIQAFRPKPGTIATIITDITEAKKLENELLETKDKFQTLSDHANDCILLLDSYGNIAYWNSAAERTFGYKKSEIIGKNINRTILHQKHLSIAFNKTNLFGLDIDNPFAGNTLELTGITKDQKEIIGEFSVTSILHNSEWHFVVVARDITSRKHMEKELEEKRKNLKLLVDKRTEELNNSLKILEATNLKLKSANKHKDNFLSTMSHELRTPLNAIIGFNKLLEKQYFGTLNIKQQEYINLVGDSSKHLLSLINDILDLTRIDSGSMELFIEEIEINECMEEIISIMNQQFKDKEIKLNLKINKITSKVRVDSRKYKQIMINLLSNALKFTNSGGKVDIEISKNNGSPLLVVVKDTGVGIGKEDINNIFKEFFQSNQTRDQALGSTGIGLALTKRLVELHNGSINVESTIGKGSKFWFSIPNNSFKPQNYYKKDVDNLNNN